MLRTPGAGPSRLRAPWRVLAAHRLWPPPPCQDHWPQSGSLLSWPWPPPQLPSPGVGDGSWGWWRGGCLCPHLHACAHMAPRSTCTPICARPSGSGFTSFLLGGELGDGGCRGRSLLGALRPQPACWGHGGAVSVVSSPGASGFGFLQRKLLGRWVAVRGEGEATESDPVPSLCACGGLQTRLAGCASGVCRSRVCVSGLSV